LFEEEKEHSFVYFLNISVENGKIDSFER